MKLEIKHATSRIKNNKTVRLDSLLAKKLKSYRVSPSMLDLKAVSHRDGPSQNYKPDNIMDYTSVIRLENIIASLTSASTLEPATMRHYSELINGWADVIHAPYMFPSTGRPSSTLDYLSYKWLSLYRLRNNLCLRKGISAQLIEYLGSVMSSTLLRSSDMVDYGQDREVVGHECFLLRHREESLKIAQRHFLCGTGTIFLASSIRSNASVKSLRDLRTLLTTRKQKIRTILLTLSSLQPHLNQHATSAQELYRLLEVLRQSTYLTEQTKGLDKALYMLNANQDIAQTHLPLDSEWNPSKYSYGALALLASELLGILLRVSPIDFNPTFSTDDPEITSLEGLHQYSAVSGLQRIRRNPIITEIIEYRAVSRTRAGGRARRFRVLVAIGRKAGWVGVGLGKHKYIPEALEQARRKAAKNIVRLRRTSVGSVPHSVQGNYKKAQVLLKPLSVGSGLMTGPCLKDILSLAGYTNLWGLQMGTSNRICNIRACLNALGQLRSETEITAAQSRATVTGDPYVSLFSALKTYVNW